jgi:hypothetical protein
MGNVRAGRTTQRVGLNPADVALPSPSVSSSRGTSVRDFRHGDTAYTFLFDEDVKSIASQFRNKRRVRTLSQVGLPTTAHDRDIVRKAWGRQFIIVTANKQHFKKRIEEFHGERGHCPCMFGLVILPSGEEIQKQVLVDFKALEQQLSFKKQSITWKDVHQKNYMVRVVKKGNPQVTELPLCVDCRKDSGR